MIKRGKNMNNLDRALEILMDKELQHQLKLLQFDTLAEKLDQVIQLIAEEREIQKFGGQY